jgi:hypothetical protein
MTMTREELERRVARHLAKWNPEEGRDYVGKGSVAEFEFNMIQNMADLVQSIVPDFMEGGELPEHLKPRETRQ